MTGTGRFNQEKFVSIGDKELPAASPLPAFRGGHALLGHIAGALRQVARGASLGHGVHDAGRGHCVDERRFFAS